MAEHGTVRPRRYELQTYREQYRQIIPSDRMKYIETYNASEGFFAIKDDPATDDMLLMLDYGVYYEFLPMQHLNDPSRAVPLEGVERGVNYALIISTCNGVAVHDRRHGRVHLARPVQDQNYRPHPPFSSTPSAKR